MKKLEKGKKIPYKSEETKERWWSFKKTVTDWLFLCYKFVIMILSGIFWYDLVEIIHLTFFIVIKPLDN